MSEYDVLIVGGGPCGLMSSLLLAHFGVSSLVIERHPDISIHPKAMGITRRTGEIYRQLGLYDRMRAADLTARHDYDLTIWSKGLQGDVLGRTPIVEGAESLTPCVRFHCPQPHTEAVIARQIHEMPLGEIWHYREVTKTEQTADGVALECVDRATEKTQRVTGRYLIAADGARSPIRESLGIAVDGPGDMGHFINTYFRANYGPLLADRKALLYNVLGEDFMEFFVAVNGQDLWLMHHFLHENESITDFSETRMVERIKYVSGMPDVSVEIISMLPWVMSPKVAQEWRRGRILLVGDAAARLSPSGGLGMNTGLHGVHNLAWKLAAVVHGDATEALLDTYAEERIGAAKVSSQSSNDNFMEIYSIVECALRGDWARAQEQIAQSHRAGSMLGLDLGMAYDKGAFMPDNSSMSPVADTINDYTPTGRPGHRAPHFWLNADKSSLDLFGRNFMVLAGPNGAPWQAALESPNWPLKSGITAEFHLLDHPDFLRLYGVSSDGAVLVRPDGYIAARFPTLDVGPEALVAAARHTLGV